MANPGRGTAERIAAAVAQAKLRAAAGSGDVAAIKRAFRRLAARAHPDVGGDAGEFRRLTEARDRLLQAHQRRRETNPCK